MNERPTNQLPDDEDLMRLQHEFFSKKIAPAANLVPKSGQTNAEKIMATSLNPISSSDSTPAIIGDIVERCSNVSIKQSSQTDAQRTRFSLENGFPKPSRIKRNIQSKGNQSLFAMSRKQQKPNEERVLEMDTSEPNDGKEKDAYAQLLHLKNVTKLEKESQILEEQKKLLQTLDPKIIKFLQSKRKDKESPLSPTTTIVEEETATGQQIKTDNNEEDNALVFDEEIRNWHSLNLNVKLEKEKMQWMKDIPNELLKSKPGETYEARFDWKGVLLPYSLTESDENRELFLHSDDAQRPGYTIQELFRLARSNVIQQRNSSIFSIAGILNIYNQGFYDNVLDLPISKIFFLLRFTFDENVQSSLEVTSNALATLFYNDCDEFLLDYIYDCSNGCQEPSLNCWQKSDDSEDQSSTSKIFAYNTSLKDEEDASNLNDFHLAENDLMKCMLRSNILQRINYILTTVRPDNSTVTNCLKILIRIARTDKESTDMILNQTNLLENVCGLFLPNIKDVSTELSTKFYHRPQYLLLKLLRIMASNSLKVCQQLETFGIDDILKSYIFLSGKISIDLIHLQIEAMRLVKVIIVLTKCDNLYNGLIPAYILILDWCYHNLNMNKNGHPIFRQHATALISLIGHQNALCSDNLLIDKLKLCFSKWFHVASTYDSLELSQNILLATCIQTCSSMFGPSVYHFYEIYLNKFLSSQCFINVCETTGKLSPLLSQIYCGRTHCHIALPSVNSIVFDKSIPSYILSEKYSIFLLTSLANLLNSMNSHEQYALHDEIFEKLYNNHLLGYIERFSDSTPRKLQGNWFLRNEILLLLAAVKCKKIKRKIDKVSMQQLAHNLCNCLTENQIEAALEIFDFIIFDIEQYENRLNFDKEHLDKWKMIFINVCILMQRTTIASSAIMIKNHDKILFNSQWTYSPLLPLFMSMDNNNEILRLSGISEKMLIDSTLSFALLRHANSIDKISPIDELQYLMMAFLGHESSFLSADTKELIEKNILHFFAQNKRVIFDFDGRQTELSFENLFIAFLEQFQATSYGDELFGSLVMIPLAMKYNVKWRKMVWSEHASVLSFIRCTDEQLINGTLDEHLYPLENDADLLNSYVECLNTKMVRKDSLPYKIATHHLAHNKRKKV